VGGGNRQQDGKGQMVRITSIQKYAIEDGDKCGLERLSMGLRCLWRGGCDAAVGGHPIQERCREIGCGERWCVISFVGQHAGWGM